jgi:hypothetical protein
VKTSNGSNIAPLYAFALSLIVCSHIRYAMIPFTAFWATCAFRHMAKPRNRGAKLTNGEGPSA